MWDFVSKLMGGISPRSAGTWSNPLWMGTMSPSLRTRSQLKMLAIVVVERKQEKCLLFITVFNLIDLIVTDGRVLFAVVLDPNSFNALTPMPASTEH